MVLLMDDEQVIIDVAAKMIRKIGYEVECARDGEEAIRRYQESIDEERKFDVVILDITIPAGLGGESTMRKLRELDPGVKGIVSSGYSDSPILAHPDAFGFISRITKPYTFGELAQVLSKVLNGEVSSGEE